MCNAIRCSSVKKKRGFGGGKRERKKGKILKVQIVFSWKTADLSRLIFDSTHHPTIHPYLSLCSVNNSSASIFLSVCTAYSSPIHVMYFSPTLTVFFTHLSPTHTFHPHMTSSLQAHWFTIYHPYMMYYTCLYFIHDPPIYDS